jgi:hypothetical protein
LSARKKLSAALGVALFGMLLVVASAQATMVIRDGFTGTDGTQLDAPGRHPSPVAGGDPSEVWWDWTKNSVFNGTFALTGNRAYAPTYPAVYTANRQMPSNEYDVQGQLYVKSNSGFVGATGLIARADTTTNSMYIGHYNSGQGRWELVSCAPTGCTLLDTAPQTLTVGTTYWITLSMRNDAKRFYVNGTQIMSSTDNSITRIGRAGIRQSGWSATPTTGYHVSSFGVTVPGSFVWTADGEHGGPTQEWNSSCSAPNSSGVQPPTTTSDRLQVVSKSAGGNVVQGTSAYQSLLKWGDNCGGGERAEWAQGNPPNSGTTVYSKQFGEGDDNYTSFQVYLTPGMNVDSDNWKAIAQWHQAESLGTPVLALDVANGVMKLDHSSGQGDVQSNDDPPMWQAPVSTGRWMKFTLHVKWSADPAVGLVELWGNPAGGSMVQLVPPTHMFTLKRLNGTGGAVPTHARIGLYRQSEVFGDESALYDGYTVATTRDAAEGLAFAPLAP